MVSGSPRKVVPVSPSGRLQIREVYGAPTVQSPHWAKFREGKKNEKA